jgi:GNAT superfamily N-acetyltransferase
MMDLVFSNMLPTEEDLKKIEAEAVHEHTVVGYFRPLFKKMFAAGYGLAVYHNDFLLGILCAVPFSRNWIEPGTFFVLKAYRGCGVGSALIKELIIRFKGNRRIYVATANPTVFDFCEQNGLKQCGNYWNLPRAVKWHLLKKVPMVRVAFIRALKRNFHKNIRIYLSPES